MFFQPPDQIQHSSKSSLNPRYKRKKRSSKKKQQVKKRLPKFKNCRIIDTMSSWAESFTTAATWQLKHQVAYWKSKAVALEYENRILHDLLKKNYMKSSSSGINTQRVESTKSSVESESESESESEDEGDNNEFEVSEEFIEFLKSNAKYKEDAKRERERLKKKMVVEEKSMEFEELAETVDTSEKLKELYGKDWQRISALEMSMKCAYINESDKLKPLHWPNIPFNFNCT